MRARDLMTTNVARVAPDATRQEIARTLLERGISAVPVVDSTGAPLGMVSEGDLIGRDEPDRKQRRDWWLAMLAEGESLNEEYLANVGGRGEATARDLMVSPLVTVLEDTDADDIARLLEAYRIKRVPVLREGRIVGIVSRADLLRVIVPPQSKPQPAMERPPSPETVPINRHPAVRPPVNAVSADDFRHLAQDYWHLRLQQRDAAQLIHAAEKRGKIRELTDHHLTENAWMALLHHARDAAEHGQREFMLIRFPSELCSDNGRAINAPEPDWPSTLRGEAAEVYLRWQNDLRPLGFSLGARVLEFPNGIPGDIGLFLSWGGGNPGDER